MKKRTVVFYRSASGTCPVEDFLDSLPGQVAQKIIWGTQIGGGTGIGPSSIFCQATRDRGNLGMPNQSGFQCVIVFCASSRAHLLWS